MQVFGSTKPGGALGLMGKVGLEGARWCICWGRGDWGQRESCKLGWNFCLGGTRGLELYTRPLTKALRIELPADWADARFPGLPLLQLQVQLLLEVHHIHPGAGGAGHLLDP